MKLTDIEFRVWHLKDKMMIYQNPLPSFQVKSLGDLFRFGEDGEYLMWSGQKDKKGQKIFEGDRIMFWEPYRTTQTHRGDNIPNGSYTEPMEPGIRIHEGEIIFKDGCFMIDKDNEYYGGGEPYPLIYALYKRDLDQIKEAISSRGKDLDIFDDPDEGDLQYLMEIAKVKTPEELVEFLNGVEIIGTIYED